MAYADFSAEYEQMKKRFVETIKWFSNTLEDNRASRSDSLAASDLKLLRCLSTNISYIYGHYEKQWQIVASNVTIEFLNTIENIMEKTNCQEDIDLKNSKNYLSILDAQILLEQSDDLIYHLVAVFEATNVLCTPTLKDRIQKLVSRSSLS